MYSSLRSTPSTVDSPDVDGRLVGNLNVVGAEGGHVEVVSSPVRLHSLELLLDAGVQGIVVLGGGGRDAIGDCGGGGDRDRLARGGLEEERANVFLFDMR